jgi:hypothetical protein
VQKGTYPCEGYIICSIPPISVGGTKEDFRAVLALIPMMNLIRITSHKSGGRPMFDKKYGQI